MTRPFFRPVTDFIGAATAQGCLILLLALGGCASQAPPAPTPWAGATAEAPALAQPDSAGTTAGLGIVELPRLLPALPAGANVDPNDPRTWEAFYSQALRSLSDGDLSAAKDLLFILQDWSGIPVPAHADSTAREQRTGLTRRVVLLGGLVAEAGASSGAPGSADSALAASYDQLAGVGFPDSLLPIVGEQRRPLVADLLRIDNAAVRKWESYFTGPGRPVYATWLQRKTVADSLVNSILQSAGLPAELIYLAMIESGLSSHAVSTVGAAGPWQFMPGTARRYGLRLDWWVDERRDLEMSTRAAAAYLHDLYERFGDWVLVLAAYNAGENRIERAMYQSGHDDFWRLPLPDQTAAYIPKYIAAARIGQDPERYGFAVEPSRPRGYDVVPVDDATDLAVVARCAGVAKEEVLSLNPGLRRRASPPDSPRYPVRVPPGTGDHCRDQLRRIPAEERLTWRRHRVSRGETLSEIARGYGTSVTAISELNRIKSVHLIHPGDQLLIPIPTQLAAKANKRARDKGRYVPPDGYEKVSYVVKKGDTLSGVARKLGVSLQHLRKVNGLQKTSLIHPGRKLYAYRPGRISAASTVGGGG